MRRHARFRNSLVASVVVHAMLVLLVGYAHRVRPEPPEERVLQIELRGRGPEPADVAGEPDAAEQPPTPTPEPPTPVSPPTAVAKPQPAPAPVVEEAPPPAPRGERAVEPAPRPPARSFAAWRSQRMGRYEGAVSRAAVLGGGSPDGDDRLTSKGRDRCEPSGGRRVDRLYLLFDSSGSMDSVRQRQALTCAHQYAKAAIDGGATVVVGNFAGSTVFSPPTRNLTDVEFALRGGVDPHATVLPTHELDGVLDPAPHLEADLVIVSDGYIGNYRDVLPRYRFFLELNPENRAMMFTVGSAGHPDVVREFRNVGFDVYVYRVI